MCIIILNKKEAEVVKPEWLKESARRNAHGAGVAWAAEGKIHTFKMLDAEPVIEKYNEVKEQYGNETDILLHFRIKTHGSVDVRNIHPFVVNKNIVMAHNGTISIDIPKEEDITDSETFARLIRKMNFWNNERMQKLISMAIGRSKLVFLNKNGDSRIINEDLGEWNEGNWFSNTSYKPIVVNHHNNYRNSTGISAWNGRKTIDTYIDEEEEYNFESCVICGTKLNEHDYMDNLTGMCEDCRKQWQINENNYELYLY